MYLVKPMAKYKIVLPLVIFLFFIIISYKVNAYEQFNYNPSLSLGLANGFAILSNSINSTYSYSNPLLCYDVTFNTSLMSIIYNNNYCDEFSIDNSYIYITPLSTSDYNLTQDAVADTNLIDSNNRMLIPPNIELIVNFRYYINETDNILPGYSNIYWRMCSDQLCTNMIYQNSSELTTTEKTWIIKSIIIPSATGTRYFEITGYFAYGSPLNTTSILIDTFDIYTFDIEEARQSYFTTFAEEKARYCGSNSVHPCINDYDCFSKHNSTLKMAYLISNDTYNNTNLFCCAFQSGNKTYVRRCSYDGMVASTIGSSKLWYMKDMAFFRFNQGTSDSTGMLVRSLSTSQMSYDYYYGTGSPSCGTGTTSWERVEYNGNGYFVWNNATIFGSTPMCNYDRIDQTLTILPIWNITGTKYRHRTNNGAFATSYYPLFQKINICTPSCTCTDAQEFCISEFCQEYTGTNCGIYGCLNDVECAFPDIVKEYGYGTFCLTTLGYENIYNYVIYNTSGSFYASCTLPNICFQDTSTTISCQNPSTYQSTSQILNITHQAGSLGQSLGFGSEGGKYLIGLFLMLLVIVSINAGPSAIAHKDYHLPKEANILVIVMLVVGLTFYLHLFDPIMAIGVIIFGGVLLAGKIVPHLAGTKAESSEGG
jgi:hypothetical protein